MSTVLRSSWPLFLGLLLLMIGNGAQGTVLGVRAVIENISTETYGFISAAYFAGFLLGSTVTPNLIRKVGHVRVFAALGSLISAAVIVYVWIVDPVAWLLMRVVIGFGFSGVYIVSESWLNEAVDNSQRGQALGVYTLTQMIGVVLGQQILNLGDPASFELFIIISVLVSLSFAPILLTVTPAPISATAKPMTLKELYVASPLGCFGIFTLGGALGTMFGMSAVYGARIELSVAEIAAFATALYTGAVMIQPVIGWLSDRMDRRLLIIAVALSSAGLCVLAAAFGGVSLGALGGGAQSALAERLVGAAPAAFEALGVAGDAPSFEILMLYPLSALVGGLINTLYPLITAHTNDFLEPEQMASASSGLVFLNGVGALCGPIIVGFAMTYFGDDSFWLFMALLMLAMGLFGVYRATQRATVGVEETSPFAAVTQRVSAVGAEMMQEAMIDKMQSDAEQDDAAAADGGARDDGR